jgi:hypothetical protein
VIEQFKNIYAGGPVCIIGSSPKIKHIDAEFMRSGVATIGLNESFLALPTPTTFVHVVEARVFKSIRKKHPRIIAGAPLYDNGERLVPSMSVPVKAIKATQEDFDLAAQQAKDGADRGRYPCVGTCFHSAVFLALYMGAGAIWSVGVDDGYGYHPAVEQFKAASGKLAFDPKDRSRWIGQRKRQRQGHTMLRLALEKVGIKWTKLKKK